jgi:hypothetical protein
MHVVTRGSAAVAGKQQAGGAVDDAFPELFGWLADRAIDVAGAT